MYWGTRDFGFFDRQYFKEFDGENVNFATFGTCSYIGGGSLEFAGKRRHISVGRFTSMSWQIIFLMGMNHICKNSATTFPFDGDSEFKRVINVHRGGGIYDFTGFTRRVPEENHYQILIGSDVWIGRGAVILSGSKIGNGAVIGAGSVVAKEIPPYAIAVGNPAKVIKYRLSEENIRKMQAVKWWNWEVDKIFENAKYMADADKFLEMHYSPELEIVPEDDLGRYVKKLRAEKREVYVYNSDFRALMPLWRRVVNGFFKSDLQNAVLIFFSGPETLPTDFEELKDFAGSLAKNSSCSMIVSPVNSLSALKNATHLIMNREPVSSQCFDFVFGSGVKILSALDEKIFPGEPPTDL